MSQQVQWRNPKAEKAAYVQKTKAAAERDNKVIALAKAILKVLQHERNQGVMYEYTYDTLLLTVALEVGFGPGAKSQHQRSQDRLDFLAGAKTKPISRKHRKQGEDNKQLMCDAIAYAQSKMWIMRHDEDDGMVALHLPGKKPPRWTVFFAEARKVIHDYEPSEDELVIDASTSDDHASDSLPLDSRTFARLRVWGETSAL